MNTLTSEQANEVFDILAREAGAKEIHRDEFVAYMQEESCLSKEFRFVGNLGFGGKYYYPNNVISCYSEDHNPARAVTIYRTNKALTVMKMGWLVKSGTSS